MKRRLRSILVSSTLVTGLVVVQIAVQATPSVAGKAIKTAQSTFFASCGNLTNSGGSASLILNSNDQQGSSASLSFWAPGSDPVTDQATLTDDPNDPPTVTFSGLTFDATIPLAIPSDLQSTGLEAVVSDLTFSADGVTPVTTLETSHKGSNVLVRTEVTTLQPLAAIGGTLTMPNGASFALAGNCEGRSDYYQTFQTNPYTYVQRSRFQLSIECHLQTEQGFVFVQGFADRRTLSYFRVDFDPAEGAARRYAESDPTAPVEFNVRGLHGTVPLFGEFPEADNQIGTATLDAVFYGSQRETHTVKTDSGRTKFIGNSYRVRGSVTFSPGGETFDMSSCGVLNERYQDISHGVPFPQ
jgi:hypothetical protein